MLRNSDIHGAAALAAAHPGATRSSGGAGPSADSTKISDCHPDKWVTSSKVDRLLALLDAVRKRNQSAAAPDRAPLSTVLATKSKSDARLAGALRPLGPVSTTPAGGAGAAGARPEKVIVFSQWTSMLDLLEVPLKRGRYGYRRLDGTMTVPARERAIGDFEDRSDVMVLLVSLKAAALGVNLTAANHVVLMDLWWNPTVEEQAIDRAHRIGQTRTVHVTRITIKGSVEERILQLQNDKRACINAALNEASRGDAGHTANKLTLEDLRYLFGFES